MYRDRVNTVMPFLWINSDFRGAVTLYASLFGGPAEPGEGMTHTIRVGDTEVIVFNGEPHMQMPAGSLVSLMVLCEDQAEVDRFWDAFSEGGEPSQCGWVTDRFGVTWQVVPRLFRALTSTGDAAATQRVFDAMMKMTKFDCAALQAAYDNA